MNEFIIYSVHPNEDNIGGDAWEYRLALNGKIVAGFGDDYHDKGWDKCKGFIEGYAYAMDWEDIEDYIVNFDDLIDEKLL